MVFKLIGMALTEGDIILQINLKTLGRIYPLSELQKKYPSGAIITDSPFNPKVLRGNTMTGNLILKIPEQKGSIPQSVIDYANNKGIIIRDVNGKEYN